MAYPAAPTYPAPGGGSGGGGGGSVDPVEPPSPTSQNVAAGGSLAAVTFGSFSDAGGRIASFAAAVTNSAGSTSFSGSGLGAYTASGASDGSAGTLSLTARDAAGNDLATAVHTFRRALAPGETWVQTLNLDVTAMTSTSLSAGSTTVDGRVIQTDASETVGGGNGLSASAGNDVLIEVSDAFAEQDRARMVILKITIPAGIGGTGTGHAIRGRVFGGTGLNTLGASPSCQSRYYKQGSAKRLQAQYQHRPSGTGSFTSSSSYDHADDGDVTTWFTRIVMVRGTYYVTIHKTLSDATPASLDAVMDTSPDTIVCGINSYQSIGDSSPFFGSQAWVGVFNQNASTLGVLEQVLCFVFQ